MNQPTVVGRSDYAASAGDGPGTSYTWTGGPAAGPANNLYSIADATPESAGRRTRYGRGNYLVSGVICRRSACKFADIPDGTSNTYLVGEKYVWPDHYDDGLDYSDNQGWDPVTTMTPTVGQTTR